MTLILRTLVLWSVIGTLGATRAEVLHVPGGYATIQLALDATGAWDTVLVAPGTYHEFLTGPPHSFALMGQHNPDSAAEFATVLDPIPMGLDTPSVLVLAQDTVRIERFQFFNRPEVRQFGSNTRSGGVYNGSQSLELNHCRFDSVASAVLGGSRVVLESCGFYGCVGQTVNVSVNGSVVASNCSFETGGYAMVTAYDSSRFVDCSFPCNTAGGHSLNLFGSHILVSECEFGPCTGSFPVIYVYPISDVRIENCVFENLTNFNSQISIQAVCNASQVSPLTVESCIFDGYEYIPPRQGGPAIDCNCTPETDGLSARIQSCTLLNREIAEGQVSPGIQTESSIELLDNTFQNLSPQSRPDVFALRPAQDTVIARDNLFLPPGLAVGTAGSYFDAQENWWGDSTGPYHSALNPGGLGSEVGNGVEFIPWLTHHPDSTDTTGISADDYPELLPREYSLRAYPNPFNPTTRIEIAVASPGEYRVVLFDVTGRQIQALFDGRVETQHSLSIDAGALPSGVYFAELRDTRGALATTKLLLLK